jgi:ankyrin repeat protein
MSTDLQKLLDEASRDGDINKLMRTLDPELLDKFDHDMSDREPTDNPLHIAASYGHVDFISKALELKPQLAEKLNREGRLPLHLAAARGHLQVIEKLADQVLD